MTRALYAGTFDPPTRGHLDLISRGLALFDQLEVTVAVNAEKRTLFTSEERVRLIQESARSVDGHERLEVTAFEGLLVDRAKASGATVLLRGIRGAADFDYEMRMAMANRQLMPGLDTVFLAPEAAFQFVSSSIVRDVHRWGGDTSAFVPDAVQAALMASR